MLQVVPCPAGYLPRAQKKRPPHPLRCSSLPGEPPLDHFVFSAFSSPSRGVTYTVVYTS